MSTHIVAVVFLAIFLYYASRRKFRGSLPLPPGPKKLPLIGNLLNMPRGNAWPEYAKWSRELGSGIISLEVFGTVIVVLNTAECASDLLEKATYSSRPHSTMVNDLMGWDVSFGHRPHCDSTWRAQRKLAVQTMNPAYPTRFHPLQIASTHDLLRRLRKPFNVDVTNELHRWAATTVMDIIYGIGGAATEPYISVAVESMEGADQAAAPGAFMVESIPLKYIPEWIPGASFQTKAREWSKLRADMTEIPFNDAKLKIESGVYTESLTSIALSEIDPNNDVQHEEDMIKGTALAVYAGGTDTTVGALNALVMAMLLYPEIQKTAQSELDNVLGHGILPTFNDMDALPFITAIIREVLRHYPVAPLAMPHAATEEDAYRGYRIPKGAIVLGNLWAILHDPETYPDPHVFNPRRFLDADGKIDPNVKDPATETYAFGLGRRICPGRHIALASLFISSASILAMYDITPEVDSKGNPIEPHAQWFDGPTIFMHLLPYQCVFKPRSKATEAALAALEIS